VQEPAAKRPAAGAAAASLANGALRNAAGPQQQQQQQHSRGSPSRGSSFASGRHGAAATADPAAGRQPRASLDNSEQKQLLQRHTNGQRTGHVLDDSDCIDLTQDD
jgi:hypothetical protein